MKLSNNTNGCHRSCDLGDSLHVFFIYNQHLVVFTRLDYLHRSIINDIRLETCIQWRKQGQEDQCKWHKPHRMLQKRHPRRPHFLNACGSTRFLGGAQQLAFLLVPSLVSHATGLVQALLRKDLL
uniref:Uncharacterized protein n=1 Tax=Rhipicephalus microplus TaxID=6941 RepID=A0A6G5AG41_RHIMP